MEAMVYRGPYKVRVEEKELPRLEHPNDAIIRVTLAAICGSDLHLYQPTPPPSALCTATRTPPVVTTAGRQSMCASRSPTSGPP